MVTEQLLALRLRYKIQTSGLSRLQQPSCIIHTEAWEAVLGQVLPH